MFLIGGRNQEDFVKNHKRELLRLLHHLMIFPLYPCCFQFAEQFRQADISGLISGLTDIDSPCISDKTLTRTCESNQNDIQSLADVVAEDSCSDVGLADNQRFQERGRIRKLCILN